MRRIVITGSSGFIGTNVAEFYAAKGDQIACVDRHPPQNSSHRPYFHNIDIMELEGLLKFFQGFQPTHLIHLAARTDLKGRSLNDYEVNWRGTTNLMAAAANCPSLERIIFTSSMLVCRPGYLPVDAHDTCPTTPYGESKVLMERRIFDAELNVPWVIIRPTSIWGPWFGEPYRNFFDHVVGRRFFAIDAPMAKKTFGYVGNAVQQIDALLTVDRALVGGKLFYIGDDPALAVDAFADRVRARLGRGPAVRLPKSVLSILARLGDIATHFGLPFPMTSFRLRNMLHDNLQDVLPVSKLVQHTPIGLDEAIDDTLRWMGALPQSYDGRADQ
jgi:nucleoside-diphosphate-sugar epimerase